MPKPWIDFEDSMFVAVFCRGESSAARIKMRSYRRQHMGFSIDAEQYLRPWMFGCCSWAAVTPTGPRRVQAGRLFVAADLSTDTSGDWYLQNCKCFF